MTVFFACSAAVLVFAAVWLAVYKFGGLDWMTDATLSSAQLQLSAANLALDGEMHGAPARLSPTPAVRGSGLPTRPLFESVAAQTRLSVPL